MTKPAAAPCGVSSPLKPGKVVVQMVVNLPSLLTWTPVLASFLKGGSEDTLSAFC